MTLSGSQETRAIAIANSRRQFATQIRTGSSLLSAAQIQRLENTRARRVLLQEFLAGGSATGLSDTQKTRANTMVALRRAFFDEIASGTSSLSASQISRLAAGLGIRRDLFTFYRGLNTDGGDVGGGGGTDPGTPTNIWEPRSPTAATLRTWDVNQISLHTGHPGPMGLNNELSGNSYARQTVPWSLVGSNRVMGQSAVFSGVANTTVTHVGFWSDSEFRFSKRTLLGTAISAGGSLVVANGSAIEPITSSLQFHDDFEDSIGWNLNPTTRVGGNGTSDPALVPPGWGYRRELTMTNTIDSGFGRHGSAAMRTTIDPHNTTGLREIGMMMFAFFPTKTAHVRRILKVEELWQFFITGSTNNIWKQYRLQQSPWISGYDPLVLVNPPTGTNSEANSGYTVCTMIGDSSTLGYSLVSAWREDDGDDNGSNSGPQCIYRHRQTDAQRFQPFGDQSSDGVITNSRWVQFDTLHALGDANQDNGIIALWVDGVGWRRQSVLPIQALFGGQLPITGDGFVTNPKSWNGFPAGYNRFSHFDNYSNMTRGWSAPKSIDCDSITIFNELPDDLALYEF